MPNWCENRLLVTGDKEQLKRFAEDICIDDEQPSISNLVPMPDHLQGIGDYGTGWALEHWGNKWGDSDWFLCDYSDEAIEVKYMTPWTPFHDKFWNAVSARYPKLVFRHSYNESGMGFAGSEVYENGKRLYENEVMDYNATAGNVDITTAEGMDKYLDHVHATVEGLEIAADRFIRDMTFFRGLMESFTRS